MKRIINFAAGHPWLILASLALFTVLSVFQLPKLHINISAESMLEKGTPAWDYFVGTEQAFGSEDLAIIVLRDPDIFAKEKLAAAHEVVKALGRLRYVARTSSLFSVPNLKNVEGYIHAKPYLDQLPETAEQIVQIKAENFEEGVEYSYHFSDTEDGQNLAPEFSGSLVQPLAEDDDDDDDGSYAGLCIAGVIIILLVIAAVIAMVIVITRKKGEDEGWGEE